MAGVKVDRWRGKKRIEKEKEKRRSTREVGEHQVVARHLVVFIRFK